MPINERFEKEKTVLLAAYDKLYEFSVIVNRDTIPEQKRLLENEQFVISICGAIKTGKSSLLNYLLFDGDEVLPIDATPETARLAKILRGNGKKAVVHFLSKQEWDDYLQTLSESQKEKESVDLKTANLTMKGIDWKAYIKDPACSIEINDWSKLKDYISKDSDWIPMVKNAEIFVDSKILENIVVVDTPGLNDPCTSRSDVTIRWVSKTDALIYVLNTKQALTKQDIDFLDEYCSFIDPEKIIIVLGKIDLADYKSVQDYLSRTINSEAFNKRDYLKPDRIYPVSVMAALLHKHPNKVRSIDHYKKRIYPELIDAEGFMPQLEKAVNTSLMASKGHHVLISHKKKIDALIHETLSRLQVDIDLCIDRLDNNRKSIEEIEIKKKKLEDITRGYHKLKHENEEKFKKLIGNFKNIIFTLFSTLRGADRREYESRCVSKWDKFEVCIANTSVFFRSKLKVPVEEIIWGDTLKKFTKDVEDLYVKTDQDLKTMTSEIDVRLSKFQTPICDLAFVYSRINMQIDSSLMSQHLELNRKKKFFFFTDNKKSVSKLIEHVDKKTSELYDEIANTVYSMFYEDIINQSNAYFQSLDAFLDGVQNNLKNVSDNAAQKAAESTRIEGEIDDTRKRIQEVQALQNEISGRLTSEIGD